jgi:hypothetical protein
MSEELLNKLAEIGQAVADNRKSYEAQNDEWWDRLSQQEREDAFYAVVKRIHKGEIVDKGTYRYILYDIFGFDGSMYIRGMDCGFMAMHNAIKTDEEEQIIYEYLENKKVPRKKLCSNKDEAGNCPLHNLHCAYPECEKKGE